MSVCEACWNEATAMAASQQKPTTDVYAELIANRPTCPHAPPPIERETPEGQREGAVYYCKSHVAPFPCPTCERERHGYSSPSTPEALDTTWLTKLMSDKVIEHERTIATLTTENARLKQEAEDEQRSQLMLGDLLGRTCDALKGKPPELTLYSTHDLPEVATALTAQLADLTAKVASVTELLRNVIGASASCSAEKGRRYKQCANCIALADAEAFLFPVPTPEDK